MSIRSINPGAELYGIAVNTPGVSMRETQRPVSVQTHDSLAQSEAQLAAQDPRLLDAVGGNLSDLIEMVSEFEQRRQQSMKELQQLAVEVGFVVAERLIRESIDRGSFSIEKVICETVERAAPATVLSVAMNPADLRLLEEARDAHPPPKEIESLKFHGDSGISQGSCQVACEGFDIASILEDEIEELKLHVMQGLENAQIERRKPEAADRGVQRYPDRRDLA